MRRKRIPKGRDRHHIVNKSNGGSNSRHNLLLIHIERHRAWHECFGNRSIREVIVALERLERAKKKQRRRSY